MKTYANLLSSIDITSIERYAYNRFDLDGKLDRELIVYSCYELGIITRKEAVEIYENLGFNNANIDMSNEFEIERIKEYGYQIAGDYTPLRIKNVGNVTYVYSKLHKEGYGILVEKESTCLEVPLQILHDVFKKHMSLLEVSYMMKVPEKMLLAFILQEAKRKQSGDVTLQLKNGEVFIYYNDVVGGMTDLPLQIDETQYLRIMDILLQNNTISSIKDVCTVDVGYDMWMETGDEIYLLARLRVNVCAQVTGVHITARILPNTGDIIKFENLNLSPEAANYLTENFIKNQKVGMNIIAGGTSSGKNTTVMGVLLEIDRLASIVNKFIVVEMPSETPLPRNFFQASANNIEEYNKYIDACLRQAGDIYYFTEISDRTGENILRVGNLGKPLYTSLHANTVEGVLMRLSDITKMAPVDIMERLNNVIVQKLVRDENGKVRPQIEALTFTEELKDRLRVETTQGIIKIIRKEKTEWM